MQRMHLALQRSAPLSEQGERRGTRTCSEKNRQRANRLSTQTDGCRKNLMKHTASHSSENYKGIKVTFSSLQTIFILYHTRSFNYHRDLSDDQPLFADLLRKVTEMSPRTDNTAIKQYIVNQLYFECDFVQCNQVY